MPAGRSFRADNSAAPNIDAAWDSLLKDTIPQIRSRSGARRRTDILRSKPGGRLPESFFHEHPNRISSDPNLFHRASHCDGRHRCPHHRRLQSERRSVSQRISIRHQYNLQFSELGHPRVAFRSSEFQFFIRLFAGSHSRHRRLAPARRPQYLRLQSPPRISVRLRRH